MWKKLDIVPNGKYIKLTQVDGIRIDPFGTVLRDELLSRVQQFAQGWTPTGIDLDYGIFGVGAHTFIYGQANNDIPAETVAAQTRAAFNSFLSIAASDFTVQVSDNLSDSDPAGKPSEWAGTLQLIALAVIAVAVVYGIRQIKEITE